MLTFTTFITRLYYFIHHLTFISTYCADLFLQKWWHVFLDSGKNSGDKNVYCIGQNHEMLTSERRMEMVIGMYVNTSQVATGGDVMGLSTKVVSDHVVLRMSQTIFADKWNE